jgi:AbrB family looped-hinge helix DNA binding protein
VEIKISSKGQIVIPSSIRRQLGIKEGTRIQIELREEDFEIILKPNSIIFVFDWRRVHNPRVSKR